MKRKVLPSILLAIVALFVSLPVAGQVQNPLLENPKYGPDRETREECIKQTSFYQEFYKQRNYKDAAHGWAIVYRICPQSSQNIFIRGIAMVKSEIDKMPNGPAKDKMVDSLMRIYDRRIEFYGNRGTNLQRKGSDLLAYCPDRLEEAHGIFTESYKLLGSNYDPASILVHMSVESQLYAQKKRTAEQVIDLYTQLSSTMAGHVAKAEGTEQYDQVKAMSETLDAQFTTMGVANCDDLERIFAPKVAEAPADVDLAQSVYKQLTAMRCTGSDLYLKVSETLFNSNADPTLGLDLARAYAAKRENSKAEQFFQRAIETEKDSLKKSNLYVEYASFIFSNQGNLPKARTVAYQSLDFNKNQGLAYMLIGSIYASTKNCGSNSVANASVFWAAVDKYTQAKNIDPALAQECNKQIAYLSQLFPLTEELFFQDISKGSTYTVPCWINERTTVRSRD